MVNSVTTIKRNIKKLEFQVRQERNTPVEPLCQENEIEDEPPGRLSLLDRDNLFSHVPQASWNDWRWQFRHRITTIEELVKYMPLSSLEQDQITQVINRYPLSITPYYLCLINQKDSHDPVRIQAIPSIGEIDCIGFEDPLDEERDSRVPGLVHRYPDRVLMVLTDICPMLCRHCTRKREWKHGGWIRNAKQIEVMLEYIRNNKSIRDIIISGGDPLVLSTGHLENIISRIRRIPHVEIIRIGTRFPVVLPQRIDSELCAMLSKYGPIWLNTHFNSAKEVTPEAAAACDRLLRSGIPINNQSVLLRGVNDTAELQTKLCHALLKIKVRPYYLFQCDEVKGTEHLRTSIQTGMKVIEGMQGFTSGLAIPNYVIDLPHGGGKIPIKKNYIVSDQGDTLILRNYEGQIFPYRNPRDANSHSRQESNEYTPLIMADRRGDFLYQLTGENDENRTCLQSQGVNTITAQ